jgi:hypothetical protein
MVDESSCDARDTCNVGRPSTAMNDVVPGVFDELEVRGVVDPQLRHARTDERDEPISLLLAVGGLRDRLDGDGVVDQAVCRTYTLGDGLWK